MNLFLAQTAAPDAGFRGIIDNLARTPLSEVVIFVSICTFLRLIVFPILRKTPIHKRGAGYKAAGFFNELLDALIYAGVFVFMLIRPFMVQAFLIPSGSMVPTLLVNDFIVANKAIYRYSNPKVGDIVVFRPPVAALFDGQQDPDGQPKVDFIKRCLGVPGDVIEVREGEMFRNGKPDPDPWRNFSTTMDGVRFTILGRDDRQMANFKFVKYDGPYEPWRGKTMPVEWTPDGAFTIPNYQIGTGISKDYALGGLGNSNPPNEWKLIDEFTPEERERAEYLLRAPAAPIPPGYYLMVGDNRNNSFDGRGWGLVPRDSIIGRSEVIWFPIGRWQRTR